MMRDVPVHVLGLGDRFRFEEHGAVHTVREAFVSVDGSVVHLSLVDGTRTTPATCRMVHLVERAPDCPCGDRYEHCKNECPWPDALWSAAGL